MKLTKGNQASAVASFNNSDPREAISFVADLTQQLSFIAHKHRFDTLTYLLDMALLEADTLRRELVDKGRSQE